MENMTNHANIADHLVKRRQEDTARFQGNMKSGKSVGKKITEIELLHQQMVGKSNTCQMKTISDAVEVKDNQEVVSIKKLIIPETEIYRGIAPSISLQYLIIDSIRQLAAKDWIESNALPLCLATIDAFERCDHSREPKNRNDYHYLVFVLRPYYEASLGSALQYLQYKADIECSWEYAEELHVLVKHFFLQTKDFSMRSNNKKKIAKLFKQCISNELKYLEYLTKTDYSDIITAASFTLKSLLENKSHVYSNGFVDHEFIVAILPQMETLIDDNKSSNYYSDANNIKKRLVTLEKKMLSGTVSLKVKRDYSDALKERLMVLKHEYNIVTFNMATAIRFIVDLVNLYKKYATLNSIFHTLGRDFKKTMGLVVTKVLLSITEGATVADTLKVEMLDAIDFLYGEKLLNNYAVELYDSIKQLLETGEIDLVKKCTDIYDEKYVDDLLFLINGHDDDRYRKAADSLKCLFIAEVDEMIVRDALSSTVINKIETIECILKYYFFNEIFQAFYCCQDPEINHDIRADRMANYKRQLIEAAPYEYLLKGDSCKFMWEKIACMTLSKDINGMLIKNSICDEDIDSLLLLKKIAPALPNRHVMKNLEKVLIIHFKIYLTHSFSEKCVRTIMQFSTWIDDFKIREFVSKELIKVKNIWEKRAIPDSEDIIIYAPIVFRLHGATREGIFTSMGGAITTQKPQSTSSTQVFKSPLLNPEPMDARIPKIAYSHSTQLYIAGRQPSISAVQQPSQNLDYALIPPPTDAGYRLFRPSSMMPQDLLPRVRQAEAAPTLEFVQQKKLASQLFKPVEPPLSPREVDERSSLHWGLQQIVIRSAQSMKPNSLESVETGATQIPTQNKGGS
ncbi:MAG: hypothetical protein KAG53_03495 [Endozoicomonadaceae bacterium]|nr:hypothetical protein [Endozoicomonadaceae bacterium]